MKNILTTFLVLFALVVNAQSQLGEVKQQRFKAGDSLLCGSIIQNAQDTVTYWYSHKQAEHRMRMEEQGMTWGDGSKFKYRIVNAPNGRVYTEMCNKNTYCGIFDDAYLVCKTINENVVSINPNYSLADSFIKRLVYITPDTLITHYYEEPDTFKVVVLITDDGRRLEINFSDEAQKFEGIIDNAKGVDKWYSLKNKYELIVYVGKAFNVKKVVEDITKQCAKKTPYVIEYIEKRE
jgi:hypothetical protein